MEQVTLEKEFYVETANQPGITSQLTALLSEDAQVNLKAFWGNTYAGKGHFSFIPENLSKAREALKSSQFSNYREEEVVVAYVKDQIGSTAEITSKLANAHININWLYTTSYNGQPAIVLSCDDNSLAVQTIQH
jgi:hypothetical protein